MSGRDPSAGPALSEPLEWRCGDYTISTDRRRFDVDVFHAFVSSSYWARGQRRETTEAVVANSLLFGVHSVRDGMVGAARVVTDQATFGWVSDVFVLEQHRGRGLGSALIAAICAHPSLVSLKRIMLVTDDAHGLYERHGFSTVVAPERLMERRRSS